MGEPLEMKLQPYKVKTTLNGRDGENILLLFKNINK